MPHHALGVADHEERADGVSLSALLANINRDVEQGFDDFDMQVAGQFGDAVRVIPLEAFARVDYDQRIDPTPLVESE